MAVWWGTIVECEGALARMARARDVAEDALPEVRARLARFVPAWTVVQPGPELRGAAVAALRRHPLTAGDALQLAAALEWGDGRGDGLEFVTLDERLARAAALEGFTVLPAP
jgi:predicted nucleic acid-binding protein